MGVDVLLYADAVVADDALAEAEAFVYARVGPAMEWGDDFHGDDEKLLERQNGRIEMNTPVRYYGIGYERGHWPNIYAAILSMEAAFPGAPIHYGGDTRDDAPLVTHARLSELWAHWLSPQGVR